jgi:hypothetical protein
MIKKDHFPIQDDFFLRVLIFFYLIYCINLVIINEMICVLN